MSRVGRCVFLPAEHKVVRAGCEGGKRRVGETLVPMSPELSRGGKWQDAEHPCSDESCAVATDKRRSILAPMSHAPFLKLQGTKGGTISRDCGVSWPNNSAGWSCPIALWSLLVASAIRTAPY